MTTVPTPITDRNGKQTTVHKKIRLAPKGNKRVSGINDMSTQQKSFSKLSTDEYSNHIIKTFGLEQVDKSDVKAGDNVLISMENSVVFGTVEVDDDLNNTYATETFSAGDIFILQRGYPLDGGSDKKPYENTSTKEMAIYR